MLASVGVVGCSSRPSAPAPAARLDAAHPPRHLSALQLFEGNGATQQPAQGVIPYDLNTPLFSDYMGKHRFVKLPHGAAATIRADGLLEFPVGTLIAKSFTCPKDLRDPSQGERLIETRILWHDARRGWIGLPYLWNEDQTEAFLEVAGGTRDLTWIHYDGQPKDNRYLIPHVNQCKGCHKAEFKRMAPIGPKVANLNRDFAYAHGTENQLAYWTRIGALRGAPQPAAAPRLAVWNDPHSGTLDARARAYLDVNCGHCHNPAGPARNSGLDLSFTQTDPYHFGIFRTPVAAGRGSGDLHYDIVPGKPDQSIVTFRMASTHPGVMMPELGKRLVHGEGLALIRDWIAAMPPQEPDIRRQ